MKKKIFIITGEASGDKLASDIVQYFNKSEYNILAIGSEKLKNKKIKLLFDSSSIAFMAPGRMARRVRSDALLSMSEDVEKPKVVLRPLSEEHNDRVAIYAAVLLNPCKNMCIFF